MKHSILACTALTMIALAACEGSTTRPADAAGSATLPAGLTGDIDHDAAELAGRSAALSLKMLDGTDTDDDAQLFQQQLDSAKAYYDERELRDDFMIVLNKLQLDTVSAVARERAVL